MNKNEFIAAVRDHKDLQALNLSKGTVEAVIDAALAAVSEALRKGDEVRLIGFGHFYVSKRAAAKGRNPQTGEEIAIKAALAPKFRAGKLLKEHVNKPRKK